jgi:hypothetical protein
VPSIAIVTRRGSARHLRRWRSWTRLCGVMKLGRALALELWHEHDFQAQIETADASQLAAGEA